MNIRNLRYKNQLRRPIYGLSASEMAGTKVLMSGGGDNPVLEPVTQRYLMGENFCRDCSSTTNAADDDAESAPECDRRMDSNNILLVNMEGSSTDICTTMPNLAEISGTVSGSSSTNRGDYLEIPIPISTEIRPISTVSVFNEEGLTHLSSTTERCNIYTASFPSSASPEGESRAASAASVTIDDQIPAIQVKPDEYEYQCTNVPSGITITPTEASQTQDSESPEASQTPPHTKAMPF